MNLHQLIKKVETPHLKQGVADVRVGETVKVHYKIREGNKERVQIFEGLVVAAKKGKSLQGSFTVRKVASGVGVERTFPLHSPWIVKIERTKSGKVRRAKLNFVRKYALSSKFKLKDKGVAGTVWETIAEEKADIKKADEMVVEQTEESTETAIEEPAEKIEDSSDDKSEQGTGESSGEPSSQAASE
jgi:large subunit ribosomal protein L19